MNNSIKNIIFYCILGLFITSFVIPSYSFNTQCLIGMALYSLLIKDNLRTKILYFKKQKFNIPIIGIPFLLALCGLIYSNDKENGLKIVVNLLPFVLIPFSLLLIRLKPTILDYCLKVLTFSTVFYCILVMGYVSYLYINQLGDYFYYENYGLFFGKHTTYSALFIALSISYLLYELRYKKDKVKYFVYPLLVGFLCLQIYFLSVRIAMISIFINTIFLTLTLKNKIKYFVVVGLTLLSYLVFNLPNFKKRFLPSMTEAGEMNGLSFREEHWLSVVETIKNNNIFFGNGTGSDRTFLIEQYQIRKLTSAYLEEYNAHNQFLEIMLDYGIIGLISFLFLLIYLYYYQIKKRKIVSLLMLNIFIIFFITESLLVRQSGIMIFALILTLITYETFYKPLYIEKNKTL